MKDSTRHIIHLIGASLIVLLITGYMAATAVLLGERKDDTPCRQLVVTIEDSAKYDFITRADLQTYLKSRHVQAVGGTVGIDDAHRIEQAAACMNLVKRAECFCGTDGTLYLQVWQRCPKFRVITPLRSYYVDDNRTTMPTSKRFTANLPIVTGSIDTTLTCGIMYDFVQYLTANEFWRTHIGEICVSDEGEVSLITCRGVAEIQLGTLEHYQQKMQTAYAWMSQYPDEALGDKYQSINIAYEGLLYARKKESETTNPSAL